MNRRAFFSTLAAAAGAAASRALPGAAPAGALPDPEPEFDRAAWNEAVQRGNCFTADSAIPIRHLTSRQIIDFGDHYFEHQKRIGRPT